MKKRKDGRYAKKVTLPDGKKKFVYGASPSEVTKKERDLLREFESGVKLRDKTTVGEWAVEWFRSYKSKLRAKTRLNITNNYNLHILPYIASIPLRDVRPIHIQQAMNDADANAQSIGEALNQLQTKGEIVKPERGNGYKYLTTVTEENAIDLQKSVNDKLVSFYGESYDSFLKSHIYMTIKDGANGQIECYIYTVDVAE